MTDQTPVPDPLEQELTAAQANYGGLMSPRLTLAQRLQRRMGFTEGYRARATQEVESGVVRVRIEAETIDRCAENLYNHVQEDNGVTEWAAWADLDEESKAGPRSDVAAVFAVLPMQP